MTVNIRRFFQGVALMSVLALPVSMSFGPAAEAASSTQGNAAGKAPAKAEALNADQLLQKATAALFPENFSAEVEMTQYKPNAQPSVSKMMIYKRGESLVRADYTYPTVQAGQKMLRKDDQIWMFMPDTKRAIKLSPKQSLGGGDFANGDIMRLNYVADYTPTIESEDADKYVLSLKAKNSTVTYDTIKWTIEKKELKSVKQEFYAVSGKMTKSLEFSEFKDYGGLKRPSIFTMKSASVAGVYTTMKYLKFDPAKTLPPEQFC